MSTAVRDTRGLVERLTPLLADRSLGERLFVVAMLESRSAERYREWAEHARTRSDAVARGFEECARREDEIAARVHRAYAGVIAKPQDFDELVAVIQREVAGLFGGHTYEEQYGIQARAERGGEGFWKDLAATETDPARKTTLLECADLEAASAEYLETLVA